MKPTARELLDRMKNATGPAGVLDIPAAKLAARVERVLALRVDPNAHIGVDYPAGKQSMLDQVRRILDGEEE